MNSKGFHDNFKLLIAFSHECTALYLEAASDITIVDSNVSSEEGLKLS